MQSQSNQNDELKIFSKDFVIIWLANFFIFLGFQMTLPTIPIFVNELGGSDRDIGIIVGIFTFSALLLRPYAGHSLESKGRGPVYIVGLLLFVVSVGSFGFKIGRASCRERVSRQAVWVSMRVV